jgi:hypothetical protein
VSVPRREIQPCHREGSAGVRHVGLGLGAASRGASYPSRVDHHLRASAATRRWSAHGATPCALRCASACVRVLQRVLPCSGANAYARSIGAAHSADKACRARAPTAHPPLAAAEHGVAAQSHSSNIMRMRTEQQHSGTAPAAAPPARHASRNSRTTSPAAQQKDNVVVRAKCVCSHREPGCVALTLPIAPARRCYGVSRERVRKQVEPAATGKHGFESVRDHSGRPRAERGGRDPS